MIEIGDGPRTAAGARASGAELRNAFVLLLLAALLCSFSGCETDPNRDDHTIRKLSDFDPANREKDKKDKKGKDKNQPDLDPDMVRNKALESVRENYKRTVQAQEKALKENARPKKETEDRGGSQVRALGNGNSRFMEIQGGVKNNKKRDSYLQLPINSNEGSATQNARRGNSTVEIAPDDPSRNRQRNIDGKVRAGSGSIEINDTEANDSAAKPGFFSRLFGKKQEERFQAKSFVNGSQVLIPQENIKKKNLGQTFQEKPDGTHFGAETQLPAKDLQKIYNPHQSREVPNGKLFSPTATDKHDTMTSRVQAELLRNRLSNEAALREKHAEESKKSAEAGPLRGEKSHADAAAPPADAEIVNIGAAAAGAGALSASKNGAVSKKSTDSAAPPPASPSETLAADAARQWGTLDQYRAGLQSRDIVERDAAFERGVREKRSDAIPYLIEEITRDNVLAEQAAYYLVAIGQTSDAVERALVMGLSQNKARDGGVRAACAKALAALRCVRAVPALMERARMDTNFTVRTTCVAALGVLGDPAALPLLREKLNDHGEIEFVRQSAALALARFGDPAGRDHLIRCLDSSRPELQAIGVMGMAHLNDPDAPGFLVSRLDSQYDEVWGTAVTALSRMSPAGTLPVLRNLMLNGNEAMRVRAALALGYLGSDEGLAFICRAARSGWLQEREMAVDLLGQLNRTDQIPLLIEKLGDSHTNIRQRAALALARMDAKQAIPALTEAARATPANQVLPAALRGAQADIWERIIMLACVKRLRGEQEDLVLHTLPNSHDTRWPEYDRQLDKQQIELIKMYKLVDVVPSGVSAHGALLQLPGGEELLFRHGETVAAGFRVVEISLGEKSVNAAVKAAPFVVLQKGSQRVTFYIGAPPLLDTANEVSGR